jgi:hypothetical protein
VLYTHLMVQVLRITAIVMVIRLDIMVGADIRAGAAVITVGAVDIIMIELIVSSD